MTPQADMALMGGSRRDRKNRPSAESGTEKNELKCFQFVIRGTAPRVSSCTHARTHLTMTTVAEPPPAPAPAPANAGPPPAAASLPSTRPADGRADPLLSPEALPPAPAPAVDKPLSKNQQKKLRRYEEKKV